MSLLYPTVQCQHCLALEKSSLVLADFRGRPVCKTCTQNYNEEGIWPEKPKMTWQSYLSSVTLK